MQSAKLGGMVPQKKAIAVFLSASLAILSGLTAPVHADTDIQFAKYLQSMKWSGDMRLRFDNEHFRKMTAAEGAPDRGRYRMRLRLGMDFGFPEKITLKTRIASGSGEQTSTNQTFGGLSDQKPLWIDRAYLEWKPNDSLMLMTGRMANPLWTQYSSDAIWDADLNPEGAGESVSTLIGPMKLFANGLQMVADEDSGKSKDQFVFSEQVGIETHLPMESRLRLAYAYHDWKNNGTNFQGVAMANGVTGSNEKVQEGNRTTAAAGGTILANNFGVNEVTAELSGWIASLPLSIQGTFLKNNRIKSRYTEKKDTGYQTGAILGKAGSAKTWEVAYFYKYLEADATVADAADSDFGDGGTNRRGHIAWIAYSPLDFLTFQAKYFQTKNIDTHLTTAGSNSLLFTSTTPKGTMDRVQIDAVVKF